MSRIYIVFRDFNHNSDVPIGYSKSYKVAKSIIKSRNKAKKKRIKQLLSTVQFADEAAVDIAYKLSKTTYHIRGIKEFN